MICRGSWLVCFVLVGCTAAKEQAAGDGTEPPSNDAGGDVPAEAPTSDGGLCCQVTHDFTDDPYWQDCRFACMPADAASPDLPWVCNLGSPTTCQDPACLSGSTCQAFNGTGIVLPCDQPTHARAVGSMCP
jgi:hypothetical protein